jgi:hypothetical protein
LHYFFKVFWFKSFLDTTMVQLFDIVVANEQHGIYAEIICTEMENSAKARGTGIAQRSPDYIRKKLSEGKAVVAVSKEGEWAGFCYIETWSHGKYVANSGLIVSPNHRKSGLAKEIKTKILELSRALYPDAKIFGLTTGLAVMKINSDLGYEPVTYSELTDDEAFWQGCQSCVNFEILQSKERKNCLCTAMLFDPAEQAAKEQKALEKIKNKVNIVALAQQAEVYMAAPQPPKPTVKQSVEQLFSALFSVNF